MDALITKQLLTICSFEGKRYGCELPEGKDEPESSFSGVCKDTFSTVCKGKKRKVSLSFHLLWETFQFRAQCPHLCVSTLDKTGLSNYFQLHLKEEEDTALPYH